MFDTEQEQSKRTLPTADILNQHQKKEPVEPVFALEESPYMPPSWEHYLDLLQDICLHRNVLIAVTAPAGAGKTTLMCQFIEIIHNGDLTHSVTHSATFSSNLHICTSIQAQTCQVFAHADLDKRQLLTLITEGFNLPPAQENTLDEQLQGQVTRLQHYPHLCLLLIDNAEAIPSQTIAALVALIGQQTDLHKRFHVILFGSPTLQTTLSVLSQDAHYAGLILTLPLTPFSLEETKNYIEQQLENNIFPATDSLSTPIVETIYKLSEGIPARINNIAPRLLIASDNQKPTATLEKFRLNQTKLIGGVLILTLIVIFSFVLNRKKTIDIPPPLVETPQDEAALKQTQTDMAIQAAQTPPADNTTSTNPAALMLPPQAAPETPSPSPMQAANNPTTQTPAAPVVTPPTPPPHKAVATYSASERYLLGIGDSNYTIQLRVSHEETALNALIQQHHLNKYARIYHTLRADQVWSVLTYGTYSSRDTAEAEAAKLPAALRKLHPYAKSYHQVHTEIRAAHHAPLSATETTPTDLD